MPDGDEETIFADAVEAAGEEVADSADSAAAAAEAAAAEGEVTPDKPLIVLDDGGHDGPPVDADATTLKINKIMSMVLTVSAAITALSSDVASIKREHSSASESPPTMAGTKGAGTMKHTGTSTAKQLQFGAHPASTPTPEDRRKAHDTIAATTLPDNVTKVILSGKVPKCAEKYAVRPMGTRAASVDGRNAGLHRARACVTA